ncbi:hypothetical protein DFR67_109158 [Williamsia limnetica]|uniref:Uncharacterized protein n=1 Tax=Williamsia limnetica TaxID=882452 RepID=A0A318RIH3_WILLI|nr:hypothetical protein DFR67_109158 [Williamsia limnetica]
MSAGCKSSAAGRRVIPVLLRRSWIYRVLMSAAWVVLFVSLYVGASQ